LRTSQRDNEVINCKYDENNYQYFSVFDDFSFDFWTREYNILEKLEYISNSKKYYGIQ